MITDLKPYLAYKDSGVEWLGEVPEGWALCRGKQLFRKMDRQVRNIDETVTCFRDGMVTLRRNRRTAGFTEAIQESGYQGIRQGDLVIHQMDAFAGAVGVSDSDGKASPIYAVCVSRSGVYACYYQHVVRQMAMSGWIAALARGVRERSTDFRFETFGQQALPFPSPVEQTAIADFLTHINLRIQRFIAAKEQLIELLMEERQEIVHQAVSHGLDPSAPRKESGVDWIGDVPAHWSVTRVKNEFQSLDHVRRPISATERELRRGPYDYYGASGVIDKVDSYLFDEDHLLIAEDGANLVLRNLPLAIVAKGRYWVNNHAHILKPVAGQLDFMALLMESLNYRPYISGAAQPKLTQDRLFSMPIAVPPVAEQKEIVGRLGPVTTPIDCALEVARRQIALLREYRTRLISDVVTGKLDVREAAENLPEDPDADNPALDERLEEVAAG